VVENPDITIAESTIGAEEETPDESADAVVCAVEETRLSISYLCS